MVWFPLPTAWFPLPMVWFPAKAHKNADFVLGRGQNQGNIAVSDTKMPILCSKCPKMGVPKAKAHKNLDFVLGRKGISTRERGN